MVSIYDGIKRTARECDLELGRYNIEHPDELFLKYCDRKINIKEKLTNALANAGEPCTEHKKALSELKNIRINSEIVINERCD